MTDQPEKIKRIGNSIFEIDYTAKKIKWTNEKERMTLAKDYVYSILITSETSDGKLLKISLDEIAVNFIKNHIQYLEQKPEHEEFWD